MKQSVCFDNSRIVLVTEQDNTVEFWSRVAVGDTVIEYRALAYHQGDGVFAAIVSAIDENDRARSYQNLTYHTTSDAALDAAERFVTESRHFISG